MFQCHSLFQFHFTCLQMHYDVKFMLNLSFTKKKNLEQHKYSQKQHSL